MIHQASCIACWRFKSPLNAWICQFKKAMMITKVTMEGQINALLAKGYFPELSTVSVLSNKTRSNVVALTPDKPKNDWVNNEIKQHRHRKQEMFHC